MRRVLILILLLFPAVILNAQGNAGFTCPDTTTYQSQFTVIPPEISPTLTDITVSALGRGNYEPILAVTTSDDLTDCYSYSPESLYIQLDLPTGTITPSPTNAVGVVFYPGVNTIQVADANNNTGAVVLLFESVIIEDNHTYQIEMTDAMISPDNNLNAYVLALDPNYQPSLTITDAEGTEIDAESAEVTSVTFFGEAQSAVSAPLPQITGMTRLTVNAGQPGVYALVIELQSGDVIEGDGIATVTESEDGVFSLSCNDESVFENGMSVQFPDDNDYTATVLATPIDPVLAKIDSEGAGFCFDDTASALDYLVNVPSIAMEFDTTNAQTVVTPDTERIVFGGHDSAPGDYVLLIEGGDVSADDDGDVFDIALTPQMKEAATVLSAYVFTADIELDPILTWEPEEGDPVVCNDAGIPDLCDQEHDVLQNAFVSLTYGLSISGIDVDPILEIPVDPETDATHIRLRVTANEETSGAYVLVLHLITN